MNFDFNRINGTLNSRTDNNHQQVLSESFSYGNLYRLQGYGTSANPQSVAYNANGNITQKSDAGGFEYATAGKPYTLSGVNNYTAALTNPIDATYTVMSRPTLLTSSTTTVGFSYNDSYDRATETVKSGATTLLTKNYFAGGSYETVTENGTEKQRLYLDGSPYTASIVAEKIGALTKLYYLHRDYLGSITQISDENANLAAEYSYDAWGRMRNVNTWQAYAPGSEPSLLFGRGYTGHEHISQMGLINMNARLYDPVLGRFLAADLQVASPEMSNEFNRYMYARNNPMMYKDPNGESILDVLGFLFYNVAMPSAVMYTQNVFLNQGQLNPAKWTTSTTVNLTSNGLRSWDISTDAGNQRTSLLTLNFGNHSINTKEMNDAYIIGKINANQAMEDAHAQAEKAKEFISNIRGNIQNWNNAAYNREWSSEVFGQNDGGNTGRITRQDVIVGNGCIGVITGAGAMYEMAAAGAATGWSYAVGGLNIASSTSAMFTDSKYNSGLQQITPINYRTPVGMLESGINVVGMGSSLNSLKTPLSAPFQFTNVGLGIPSNVLDGYNNYPTYYWYMKSLSNK